ncbi:MAG: hypothetical protein AAF492_31570, partial [Verrucomicrobiota bacterium]
MNAVTLKRLRRWTPPGLALLLMLVTFGSIWWKLKDTTWSYYTNEADIQRAHNDTDARMVLWDDPQVAFGSLDGVSGLQEPTFSPNGATALFVQGLDDQSDLFSSDWNGRVWSGSNALARVNSPANERGAAVSKFDRLLFFSSDREGG